MESFQEFENVHILTQNARSMKIIGGCTGKKIATVHPIIYYCNLNKRSMGHNAHLKNSNLAVFIPLHWIKTAPKKLYLHFEKSKILFFSLKKIESPLPKDALCQFG